MIDDEVFIGLPRGVAGSAAPRGESTQGSHCVLQLTECSIRSLGPQVCDSVRSKSNDCQYYDILLGLQPVSMILPILNTKYRLWASLEALALLKHLYQLIPPYNV